MNLVQIYTWVHKHGDKGVLYIEDDVEIWIINKEICYVNGNQVDIYLFCNSAPKEWNINEQKI